jgi:hypothetical protein
MRGTRDDQNVAVGLELVGPLEVDHPPLPVALDDDAVGPTYGSEIGKGR